MSSVGRAKARPYKSIHILDLHDKLGTPAINELANENMMRF